MSVLRPLAQIVTSLSDAASDLAKSVETIQGISRRLRRLVISRDALISVDEAVSLIGIGKVPGRRMLVDMGVVLPLRLRDFDPERKTDGERVIWGDVLEAIRERGKSRPERVKRRPRPRAVTRGEW